ncbi:MAG: hypothetical protein HGA27_00225 [Peptococcaceae bacterium]|nr:hypothetical protein [Peptococcaceae bacterium]
MFGALEMIYSFVRRQIGLRTDVDSATGSAHAKLGYIKTAVAAIKKKGYLKTSFGTTSTSYATALDVAGSGKLDFFVVTLSTNSTPGLKITVDGNVLCDYTLGAGTSSAYYYPIAFFPLFADATKEIVAGAVPTTQYMSLNLEYKASLKIELKTTAGTATIRIGYSIDT